MKVSIPLIIGISVAIIMFLSIGWWGFLIIFPWIGFSISLGIYIMSVVSRKKKYIGRKVAILMILPILLFFVPISNNENFQMEGIVLIILIGYFNKGFIHYAVAKIFGPLIWGRGFCGWACWTAAVLDWLPIKKEGRIPYHLRKIRYITFALSIALPVTMVFFLGFDVRRDYLNKTETHGVLQVGTYTVDKEDAGSCTTDFIMEVDTVDFGQRHSLITPCDIVLYCFNQCHESTV